MYVRGGYRIWDGGPNKYLGGITGGISRDAAGISGEGTEGGPVTPLSIGGGGGVRKFRNWSALGVILSVPEQIWVTSVAPPAPSPAAGPFPPGSTPVCNCLAKLEALVYQDIL